MGPGATPDGPPPGTPPGALYRGQGRTDFHLWAPRAGTVDLTLEGDRPALVPLAPKGEGWWWAPGVAARPGAPYRFRLDGGPPLPDPASLRQAGGLEGPSVVVDRATLREDRARHPGPRLPIESYILYELHVGAFTGPGTFAAAREMLPYLADLGVTAVEIMPLAHFPGRRGWGYDGALPWAVHGDYGTPEELGALVDACHDLGLAAVLDLVTNHLGPEGCVLERFGPYASRRSTPWGRAPAFTGPAAGPVRDYFVGSALWWCGELGFDALRLDAVHAIPEAGRRPFLAALHAGLERLSREVGRPLHLIAEEGDAARRRLEPPPATGRDGHRAWWCDALHRALHARLTGERTGHYTPRQDDPTLAAVLTAPHPDSAAAGPLRVLYNQNHDLVGNRSDGARIASLAGPAGLRAAAALVILGPGIPLLFMGEEYGTRTPFHFFVDLRDPGRLRVVRRGRRAGVHKPPRGRREPPDPAAEATFLESGLDLSERRRPPHRPLWALHRELLGLRKRWPGIARPVAEGAPAGEGPWALARGDGDHSFLLVVNAGPHTRRLRHHRPGRWIRILDTNLRRWGGPGESGTRAFTDTLEATLPPWTVLLYRRRMASARGRNCRL